MSNFLRILGYARKYYFLAFLNMFFNLLAAVFSAFSIAMIMPFLTLLFDKEIGTRTTIPPVPDFSFTVSYVIGLFNHHFIKIIVEQGKMQALYLVCALVVIIFFLKNLFRYLAMFFLVPLRNGVVKDIRQKLFEKLLTLPLSYFSKERKGDILAKMTSDVQEIEYGIISTLEALFKEPVILLIFLGLLLYVNVQLTVFVLVMILFTALIIGSIGKTLKRAALKGQSKLGDMITVVEESLSGMRIVKAFTAERYQLEKFGNVNQSYFRTMTRALRQRDLSSPLTEFLGITILAVVLWFGGKIVLEPGSSLQPEAFIFFMVTFSQLIAPAKSFSTAYYNIQKGLASAERIGKILDADIRIRQKPDAKSVSAFLDKIEFRNVSFAYYNYDDKRVLQNINLTIRKGKMVALVGQSGAGKSTLVDLIPRFYDPSEGEILIDGVNIKDYQLADLRKLMGIVTQESILFNDTVANNIRFGVEKASLDDIVSAAKVANAHDFIMRLENGYDTVIGDRGHKLSGGERQRLTIARAILSDPPILILDEATSSLDTENEKLVQDAVYRLMEHRTSIVIAHRLSTIQYADEIVVLQDGKIIEQGNHISLMAKDGIYKKLVDLQAF
ncbi:MAG TPA: ABC transporter ATP-binding protein [Chitinophagales bacterium]|nr:ABC transporter ATP-binding protein [Chitinophagales bacterium]